MSVPEWWNQTFPENREVSQDEMRRAHSMLLVECQSLKSIINTENEHARAEKERLEYRVAKLQEQLNGREMAQRQVDREVIRVRDQLERARIQREQDVKDQLKKAQEQNEQLQQEVTNLENWNRYYIVDQNKMMKRMTKIKIEASKERRLYQESMVEMERQRQPDVKRKLQHAKEALGQVLEILDQPAKKRRRQTNGRD